MWRSLGVQRRLDKRSQLFCQDSAGDLGGGVAFCLRRIVRFYSPPAPMSASRVVALAVHRRADDPPRDRLGPRVGPRGHAGLQHDGGERLAQHCKVLALERRAIVDELSDRHDAAFDGRAPPRTRRRASHSIAGESDISPNW